MDRPELPTVIFEATSACNLRCGHCYNHWHRPGGEPPVPPARYRDAKRTLAELFRQAAVRHVTMSGGEPLLAERLPELVLFCALRGKSVAVITNGTVGSRDDYRMLAEVGVQQFEIPLHSAGAGPHDVMSGVAGAHQAARRSIESVLQLGANLTVAIVLTRHNHEGLAETLAELSNMGASRVMLNRFNVGGRGVAQWRALALDAAELRNAYGVANALAGPLGLRITGNVCTPRCVLEPRDYPQLGFSRCVADVRRRPVAVDTAGQFRVCNHSPVVVGNLHRTSVAELVRSEYVASWEQTVPQPCEPCARFADCFGGCRAVSEQLGLGLDSLDPTLLPDGPPTSAA